jgi:hypothetical protein
MGEIAVSPGRTRCLRNIGSRRGFAESREKGSSSLRIANRLPKTVDVVSKALLDWLPEKDWGA